MEKIKKIHTWIKAHPISSFFCALAIGITCGVYISAVRKWDMEANEIGDAFGYWNSIFSGVALIGLVYSLILQGSQIKEQGDQLRKDNFEATFFKSLEMLKTMSGEVRNPDLFISERDENEKIQGMEVFDYVRFYLELVRPGVLPDGTFTIGVKKGNPLDKISCGYSLNDFFNIMYDELSDNFGPYYCFFYNLLSMVDESTFLKDQQRYANLIRSTLFQSHVILLALNCASECGAKKFRPLLVKWRILKYLPMGIVEKFELKKFYPDGIYANGRYEPEEY